MAGYAFARLRFRGREVLFILVLATMMIPDQLRLVPVYQIMLRLGLTAGGPMQFVSVTLVMGIAAVSVFLMRQYFLSIPRDLEEAAKIDGAGFFTTFWRVMLPLADTGHRRRRDPPVPGRVERLLLAAGAAHGQGQLDPAAGPEPVPGRSTPPTGRP